ncbi:MAG: hypothetical protein JWM31_1732, partial [Solirubrobacterales bacterium]|nr:hypothetical protein [Solirubrobacterales bacterium]
GSEASVRVGLRNLALSAGFALDVLRRASPATVKPYGQVRDLLARFAQVDVERDLLGTLSGDATISAPPDLGSVTLRATAADPEALRSALQRLVRIGRLAGVAGSLGLGVDTGGIGLRETAQDTYEVTREDTPIAVLGLRENVLILSSDPGTDVDAAVDALPEAPGDPGVKGALRATLTSAALGDLLVDRLGIPATARSFLASAGDPLLTGRAELSSLLLGLDVPLSR